MGPERLAHRCAQPLLRRPLVSSTCIWSALVKKRRRPNYVTAAITKTVSLNILAGVVFTLPPRT
jgi:hypothetical protein